MGKTFFFGKCAVYRAPEHSRLHEVVEVAGLEGGVLAVVGETQELSCFRLWGFVPFHPVNRADAHQGGRCASAIARKTGEFSIFAGPLVFNATAETESERLGEIPAGNPIFGR